MHFWQIADVAAPSIILGQAIRRWGTLLTKKLMEAQLALNLSAVFPLLFKRHVDQRPVLSSYLSLQIPLESDGFPFSSLVERRKGLVHGQVFLNYLILYSWDVFIEGLRTDSLMLGPFRVAQLVGVGLILFGALYQIYLRNKAGQILSGS